MPVGSAWSPRINVGPKLFAVSPDAKMLYFGGSWDNSLRVYSIKSGKQISYAVRHIGECHTSAVCITGCFMKFYLFFFSFFVEVY